MRAQKQGLLDKAKLLNIDRYFTDIVIAPYGKFSTLKSFSELCAVIGDTEYDIDPARELGVMSIGITTGIRSHDCLKCFNPDYIIDRLREVIGILCV
jgi:phosphoglycolate phosphatase-like HAD superfamily hydrolase